MRILIHGINYAPELTGIGKYTGELAEWLAARGHRVRVVTAPPYYPHWHVVEGYSGTRYRREQLNGVDAWRCPLYVPTNPSGLKRILHLASFALSSLPVMVRQIFWKPDVIVVIEPPLLCAPAAWLTARLSGAKCWLHVQDFEVDAAFELGILPFGWMKRIVSGIERRLMRRFDRVSTISDNMIERLEEKGVRTAVLFPNWVDTERIFPLPDVSPLRRELGIAEDAFVALYSGNMGRKQGLEIIIEAAGILSGRAGLHFVLCGDGAVRDEVFRQAAGLPNVSFHPLQPVERLNDLLNMADVHLLPQKAGAADLVMPSKLTGMLASGRPVVASAAAGTQIAGIVRHCGKVVAPGDGRAFADAIAWLWDNPDEAKRLGDAGRRLAVELWGAEAVLSRFGRELLRLAGKRIGS